MISTWHKLLMPCQYSGGQIQIPKQYRFWSDFFSDITVHFQHFVINQKALHFTENKIQWNQMFSFSTLAPSLLVSLTMLCLVTLCIFLCIFVQVQKRLLIQILTSQFDRRDYNLTGGTSCSRIMIMYTLKSQWKLMYVLTWLRQRGSKLNCWASAVFTTGTIESCISYPKFRRRFSLQHLIVARDLI